MKRSSCIYKNTPKTKEIKNLIKNGYKRTNDLFVLYYLKNNIKKTRFFIANISKKAIARSCDRNLIKRRIKAILNKHKNLIKNLDILIITRHRIIENFKFTELEKILYELLSNIGVK